MPVKYLRLWPLIGLLHCLPLSAHANGANFSRTNRDTTNDEIYKLAEQSPTFPGGPEEFNKFLSTTLRTSMTLGERQFS